MSALARLRSSDPCALRVEAKEKPPGTRPEAPPRQGHRKSLRLRFELEEEVLQVERRITGDNGQADVVPGTRARTPAPPPRRSKELLDELDDVVVALEVDHKPAVEKPDLVDCPNGILSKEKLEQL